MIAILETLVRVGRRIAGRAETRAYPETPPPMPARGRGRLVLSTDPDGTERCVACGLCAVACPVDCIDLAKAETADGRWYPSEFRVNLGRCIFCGWCEEACPTYAIQLVPDFELAEYHRDAMVYEKAHLAISGPGKYPGYRYWDVAGKAIAGKDTGEGAEDAPPTDLKGLTP